jgi:hypothetical protein
LRRGAPRFGFGRKVNAVEGKQIEGEQVAEANAQQAG